MIREFRLSSTMGDTVTPERPEMGPLAFLAGLLASSCIPLIILFWM